MTTRQMVEKYMEANGLMIVKGDPTNISPLIPFFIMDAGYQYYCKDVKPLPLRHQAKQYRRRWKEAYQSFNQLFLKSFAPDELDEVQDIMDEFQSFIGNDLTIVQLAGMKCFEREFPLNDQTVLSSILMTNSLARVAQLIWCTLLNHKANDLSYEERRKYENNDLNGVMTWSRATADQYMRSCGKVECLLTQKEVDYLQKCTDSLCHKISMWLKTRFVNEQQS